MLKALVIDSEFLELLLLNIKFVLGLLALHLWHSTEAGRVVLLAILKFMTFIIMIKMANVIPMICVCPEIIDIELTGLCCLVNELIHSFDCAVFIMTKFCLVLFKFLF